MNAECVTCTARRFLFLKTSEFAKEILVEITESLHELVCLLGKYRCSSNKCAARQKAFLSEIIHSQKYLAICTRHFAEPTAGHNTNACSI